MEGLQLNSLVRTMKELANTEIVLTNKFPLRSLGTSLVLSNGIFFVILIKATQLA